MFKNNEKSRLKSIDVKNVDKHVCIYKNVNQSVDILMSSQLHEVG